MKQLVLFLRGCCFARPYPVKPKFRSGPARSRTRRGWAFLILAGFWLNLILALTVGMGLSVNINNTARAQVVTPAPLENSIYDSDTFKVADQLQCPVCLGVTVAYSNSGLAQQMRLLIKKKLEAGETRDQILQYFVDRYGESILTNPPKSGFTLLVWLLPVAGLLVGAGTVGYALRGWKARIRSRTRLVQPDALLWVGPSETGGQPTGEGTLQETLPSYSSGLNPEKLQEYQARVEAELADFVRQEEGVASTAPGRTDLTGLSKPQTGPQTKVRSENKPAGKGLN